MPRREAWLVTLCVIALAWFRMSNPQEKKMQTDPDMMPATDTMRVLVIDYDKADVTWKQFYGLILAAKIPAERIKNRFYVRRSDLPLIAKVIGAVPKTRSNAA